MPKFGTKTALWGEIWKHYCHIWSQHPRICLFAKFRNKTKIPKFRTNSALFGYFWIRILKNYCHIWNQLPQTCQKWVFDSYSQFWYRARGSLFLMVRAWVRARFIKYVHLSLFQPCFILQILPSNLHLHLQVSCHFIFLVSLVIDIRLNALTYILLTISGTDILHMDRWYYCSCHYTYLL